MKTGQKMELSTNMQTHKYSPNKFSTVAWICKPPTFLPEQMKVIACLSVTQRPSPSPWKSTEHSRTERERGGKVDNWELSYTHTHPKLVYGQEEF